MAQLNNMMGNQWNMNQQGWPGHNFNGSNMSLNMMPSHGYIPNDQQMWNPMFMPQQQFGFPMMPGGKFDKQRGKII